MPRISDKKLHDGIRSLFASKERNFLETLDAQVLLKKYDLRKDKRFNESFTLPHKIKDKKFCMIADEKHMEQCKEIGIACISLKEALLLGSPKQKTERKKLIKRYQMFLITKELLKETARGICKFMLRAGKFPVSVMSTENLSDVVENLNRVVHFRLKKEVVISYSFGNKGMDPDHAEENFKVATESFVGVLKKKWQNVRSIHIKSTMGQAIEIYS